MKTNVILFMSLALLGCTRSDARTAGSESASIAALRVGTMAQDDTTTDRIIIENVRRAIRADKVIGADAAAIAVEMKDRVLILSGFVSSAPVKEHVTSVAEAVGNVRSDNQLVIDPVETTVDHILSERVRQALLDDKDTEPDAAAIRIFTRDGAVTLRGFVRTPAVKKRMVVVTRSVGSVVHVESQLVVDAETPVARESVESDMDNLISERVHQALLGERTVAAEAASVLVVTQDGVVRLSGTVASEAAKTRIGVVANAVGSVKRVENQLEVKAR